MKKRTVISMEQALSLPSATLRFAQLGWRVIRIEATPQGSNRPGDPNRYTGTKFLDHDRRAFFIAPNLGKESVVLNLKEAEGREILHRMIRELEVDIFCCNTLPGRYCDLGIDYETLSGIKPDLIWAAISAMGPEYPYVPGYDPVIQSMSGIMELIGEAGGQPYMSGVPLCDLKAGDEVYANVALALAERAETGKGQRIDVSMLQASASWLINHQPLLNFEHNPAEVTRSGNQDRFFIPTDIFKTRDGYLYIAVGTDLQWQRLVEIPEFTAVDSKARKTLAGRHQDREAMYAQLHGVTRQHGTRELTSKLQEAKVPCGIVNTVRDVIELDALKNRLMISTRPDGEKVYMQPPAVERADLHRELAFAPRYGEHTDAVLSELGYPTDAIAILKNRKIVSGPLPEATEH